KSILAERSIDRLDEELLGRRLEHALPLVDARDPRHGAIAGAVVEGDDAEDRDRRQLVLETMLVEKRLVVQELGDPRRRLPQQVLLEPRIVRDIFVPALAGKRRESEQREIAGPDAIEEARNDDPQDAAH